MTSAGERGYAMAALLAALAVMGIMLSVALPAWRTIVQREREAELVFRGQQYVQAIELFSRRTGGFPTSLEMLRDGRFIRKLYTDPITNTAFQPVYLGQATPGVPGGVPGGAPGAQQGRGGPATSGRGQPPAGVAAGRGMAGSQPFSAGPLGQRGGAVAAGPIIGVMSRSTAESIRAYNGRNRYNEWLFVSTATTNQPGGPPGQVLPGRGGQRGFPQGGVRGGARGGGFNPPNRGGMRGLPLPGRGTPFGAPYAPQPVNPNQAPL